MARLKGSVVVADNKEVRKILMSLYDIYDSSSYSTFIPDWIDDCIRGGVGQMCGDRKPSTYKVYQYLTYLDQIDPKSVQDVISVKKMAIEGKPYSIRYAQKWSAVLKCASEAIAHHINMYPEKLKELEEK